MGEMKSFQVCYEGDLSIELVEALGRLGAEPNFDNSWELHVSSRRHSVVLLRYLRRLIPPASRLLVGWLHHSRSRDFLLVRHSLSERADYSRLQIAMGAFGQPIEIGFDCTYIIRADTQQDVQKIGDALAEQCLGDSLMVTGLSYDFAIWSLGGGRMMMPLQAEETAGFRSF